jgi:hypothetical protein
MKCDFVDTQLRSLEALFGPIESFLSSVFGSAQEESPVAVS